MNTVPRHVQGPVAERLQQQDGRLHAVEQALAQLQETQTQQSQVMDNKIQTIATQVGAHVAETKQGFDTLFAANQQMQIDIAGALPSQENRMAKSFDDLKALIVNTRGHKRGAVEDEELLPAHE